MRELKVTDREFWEELTQYDHVDQVPATSEANPEDITGEMVEDDDTLEDDSNVSVEAVIARVVDGKVLTGVRELPDSGALVSAAEAELLEGAEYVEEDAEVAEEELGRGKRRKLTRDLGRWNGEQFW